ncbi:hypothetical protein [Burkholderia sp. LMG 32019]|uniref:hypothetical protein n=1 Tax=Burkholderia sp. LMG 32019 TaxID=3158173 RepID=UPI003C2EE721
MVGPFFRGGRPYPALRQRKEARHGFIGHASACASCRAAERDNDNCNDNDNDNGNGNGNGNGNTAAIITSRIDVVAPVQPGQRIEETGRRRSPIVRPTAPARRSRSAIACAYHRWPRPRRIRRFSHVLSSG